MSFSNVLIKARLEIDGTSHSCDMASITYQLNTIPQAVFSLPLGRDQRGKAAAAHKAKFEYGQPVKFYATLTHGSGIGKEDLPKGEVMLFDGLLTGRQPNRTSGAVAFLIHASGWLLDMDASSATSAMSHPQNPAQFSYRAVHEFDGAGGVSWTPFTSLGKVTTTTLAKDFWGDAILPWFKELTSLDRINTEELTFLSASGGNDAAAAALDRFTTSAGNYVPLAFDFKGADSQSIAESIWNDIQTESFESVAGTTLWSKLMQLASTYMFAVVPRVEDAIVVPYVPGLRRAWKHSIRAKDYDACANPSTMQQSLLGVGVMSGIKLTTGADNRPSDAEGMGRLGVGGWYSPEGAKGQVKIINAPRWLMNVAASDRYASFSAGSGVKPIGTAQSPGTAPSNDGEPPPPPETLRNQAKTLMDAYAESIYVYERLRLSQLSIEGKVRFDICPGSSIWVEGMAEKFLEEDMPSISLCGDVIRTTIVLDSEGKRAGTSFNIGHIRSIEENEKPGFSIDRHPFWDGKWTGAGLIKEFD